MEKLKPCPFCGGEVWYIRDEHNGKIKGIKCNKCGALIYGEENKVIKAWNKRIKNRE